MSRIEKLKVKLYRLPPPNDFTWNELKTLLCSYGFREIQGNGSRVKFIHDGLSYPLCIHKPHPENTLKKYIIELVKAALDDIECL